MKVLVTGGTGQVGSRLVRQLLARNHEVRATVWAKDPALERIAGLDVETREGELTDLDFVRSAVAGVDAVIHTANLVGPYFENNLTSGQANKGSELYMPDGTELWQRVEAQAEDPAQPCIVTDLEGRPWYYQPNDARDVAHALVCALERPEALGESFNLGAPAPFLFPEGARLLAELTGRRPLEIKLPVQWRYDHAIGKAKAWLGYHPRGDLRAMM